tara:strand:+ start:30 stop:725 length:696 start_codon:yes stop_codon:yes gene_type:complete
MPIPIYSIKDLHFSNQKNELFIKQFDIHRGACYVFEGKMGSGKTTLLDILYSRRKINAGDIHFEQKNIRSYSNNEYQNQIAVVPQRFISPWGTVKNYIFKTIKKYSHIKNVDKHFDSIVKKMNLSLLLNRKMKTLTPGECRWVVLASQIASDTKVLFIDEYELHLGKDDINKLNNILYRKINYDGVTLITSTHNRDLLSRLASVIITLENGRIIGLRSFSKRKENNKKYKK